MAASKKNRKKRPGEQTRKGQFVHIQPAPGPVPSAAEAGAQCSPYKSICFMNMSQEALARPPANNSRAADPVGNTPATGFVCLIASYLRFHCSFFDHSGHRLSSQEGLQPHGGHAPYGVGKPGN